MADNITILDGNAGTVIVRTTDNAGVHTPHHIVDSLPDIGGTVTVGSIPDIGGTVTIGAAIPSGTNNIGDVDVLTVPLSSYLGGTAAACGTASTEITVPAGATSAWIRAAGAAVYWAVNGASAGTASPGYVDSGMTGYVPPISNFTGLYVAGESASAVAHIEFYED
jgi:hypothetical protein